MPTYGRRLGQIIPTPSRQYGGIGQILNQNVQPMVGAPRTPPAAAPGAVPPPGPADTNLFSGSNPMERVINLLSNPAAQAWLLNLAQGLAQPKGPGQTGVTNLMSGLSNAYRGLEGHQMLQFERDRMLRGEQREQEQHESQLETEETSRGYIKGQMKHLQELQSLQKEQLKQNAELSNLDREALMQRHRDTLELRGDELEQRKAENQREIDLAAEQLELKRQELEANKDRWTDQATLEEQKNRLQEIQIGLQRQRIENQLIQIQQQPELATQRMVSQLAADMIQTASMMAELQGKQLTSEERTQIMQDARAIVDKAKEGTRAKEAEEEGATRYDPSKVKVTVRDPKTGKIVYK